LGEARHIYGVRAVERMTGLSAETIVRWQREHGVATPIAGPTGDPLFSRDDVARLLEFARTGVVPRVADAVGAERGDREPAGAPQLLILLAERDRYAADLTEYFLRTEGYRVQTVFSAEEAEDRFEHEKPDLVIVELLLGGGAGFELARQLAEANGAPVVVISPLDATDHPAVRGAAAVLRKPIAPLEIISTVRDLLGTSALVRGTPE
jgi:CheY-like chemotaxis protein